MKKLIERLENRFTVMAREERRDNLVFVTIPSQEVVQAVTHLRDIEGFRHLVMISAVDYIERGAFQVTYILHNYKAHSDIGVRTEIDRNNPVMEGIHHLWATARVYQQELREMLGIDFPGSPRVDEPMILEGWDDIPPLRKDFDTKKYAEEKYFPREGRVSYDPAEVMKEKNYPLEAEVKKKIQKLLREGKDED